MSNTVDTYVINTHVYDKDVLYRVILEYIPNNRKANYYPAYYYENPKLLCTSEMNTIDAPLYHEQYTNAMHTQHQANIRTTRSCAIRWCVFCVTAKCIRSAMS